MAKRNTSLSLPTLNKTGFREEAIYPEMSEILPDTLEQIEEEIQTLNSRVWECGWYIGKRLLYIKENYLTELNYSSISEYANEKFNFGTDLTSRFIFIANIFDIADVRQFRSKLRLLQGLDRDEIDNYLEWMKSENPTYKELENKVKSDKNVSVVNREEKEININKTVVKVNLRKMGLTIPKDRQTDFLRDLESLCRQYGA